MSSASTPIQTATEKGIDFLSGGGKMGELMRSFDWSETRLGNPGQWPQSLKTSVGICLNSRFPIVLWWGPEMTLLYNDDYSSILGSKHPHRALGLPGKQVWEEIWPVIGPLLDRVLQQGEANWADDMQLFVNRSGYLEEGYFRFSYSPIRDESGGIGGIFTPVTETTSKVIAERRLRTLRELAEQASQARTPDNACAAAIGVLKGNPYDVPFAALYLVTAGAGEARLAAATSAALEFPDGMSQTGDDIRLFGSAAMSSKVSLISPPPRFLAVALGPWGDPSPAVVSVPVFVPGQNDPAAFLIAGISARREFDESYRQFFEIVGQQVGALIANAKAYEEEHKRADALAEIDRAKTAFFSNVSHEFRTPLTLLLGPLADELADAGITALTRERLELAHRNALRLQRLVNSLLDFSRIEAGRIEAAYRPTDLATFTVELASNFRSVIEQAGLEFLVDCPPLAEPIYVDRQMWEKIVLNLLSNAFKFTFDGSIAVRLAPCEEGVQLAVRDTGAGIPASALPRLFERFHRVEDVRGRTFEGTGIGLALVKELVKLHGGNLTVESAPGRGSTFRVFIPAGTAHLPKDRIENSNGQVSNTIDPQGYVGEARQWLPATTGTGALSAVADRRRVLVVDDNVDMREYITRLLNPSYNVIPAANGEHALVEARASRPDLVLADVMMPGLDGFGLLRELRGDDRTRNIPLILVSARAGEESRIEGMNAGADEYLVKPFSAGELLARVGATLTLSRMRREAADALRESEERYRLLSESVPQLVWSCDAEGRCDYLSSQWRAYTGVPEADQLGYKWLAALHPEDRDRTVESWRAAVEGRAEYDLEFRIRRHDGKYRWFKTRARSLRSDSGTVAKWIGTCTDIDNQVRTERALRRANQDLEQFAYSASHDLREPVRNVTLFSELLKKRYSARLDDEGEQFLTQVIEAAQRIHLLIDDLLAYARAAGSVDHEEKCEPIDANVVLNKAISDLAASVRESGAEIVSEPLPLVRIRETQLEQLFQNLIGNAIKYRKDRVGPCVRISAERAGEYWQFAVADDGIGIDPEYKTKIFGMFTRLHGRGKYLGTGMGLAICQKIIEGCGGRIWVESQLGEGAVFYFTLPAA